MDQAGGLAARNPNTQLVIDHLGLPQPHVPPAPTEPFPYRDIWDPLGRVFDTFGTFGFNRCMWGTDWTRAVNLLSYEQGVEACRVTDRLSDSDKAALMGETLSKIYSWSPGKA